MTNQQGAPEALHPITRYEVVDCIDSKHVPAVIPNGAGPWVRYEDHVAALVEAQQPATHVQKPAGIEHVAGDVSKNGPGSNMAQQPAPSAAAAGGLPIAQEPKYTVTGAHIVNRATDEAVPHDEPVFVFRARDALGVRALEAYLALIGEREPSSAHADAVRGRIADFRRFAASHPDRMKWPDTDPTPQADSQPAPDPADIIAGALQTSRGHAMELMQQAVDADRAARAPADSVTAPAGGVAWRVRMICCGKGEGFELFKTWDSADAFRNEYTSGYGVEPHGFSAPEHSGGHRRAAIVEALCTVQQATPPAQAADSVLEDAARWKEVLMHIGADNLLGSAQYVLRGIKVPVNVLQGSVAQHFTKSIDAARKQGGAT